MEREIYHESNGSALTLANVLIVLLLIALVGFGVWYFTANRRAAPAQPDQDGVLNINVGGPSGANQDQNQNNPGATPPSGSQTY